MKPAAILSRRPASASPGASAPHALAYLFASGERGALWDVSTAGSLFQDAAGSTPVTASGQSVGLLLDRSGNGNHLSQATNTYRPTYVTIGGLHWLDGNSVQGYNMDTVNSVAGLMHAVVAARFNDTIFNNFYGLLSVFNSADSALFFTGANGTVNWYSSAGANLTNFRKNGVASQGAPMNAAGVCSVSKTTGNPAPTNVVRLFGDRTNTGRFWNGRFYGGLIIDRVLNSTELSDVETYFTGKI